MSGGLRQAWNAFWFAEGSSLGLGLFRILFAACLWLDVTNTFNFSVFAIDGGFHLPYLDAIPTVAAGTYRTIHWVKYPLIVFLGLGLFTRASCGLLLLLQGYVFFADQLNFRNHPYFFLLVLLILLLAPAADALSLSAVIRAWRERRPLLASVAGSRRPLTYQRLIQVQVCIVYVYAGLHKLSPAFLGGHVLSSALTESLSGRLQVFVRDPGNLIVPSVLSVALELLLPFALWWRRSRPWAILAGIPFHLAIAFGMTVYGFSLAMLGSYLLFLDPETLPAVGRRIGRWLGGFRV